MKKYAAPPAMTIDPAKSYTATMETSAGTLVLDLFAADAPITVNNFVFLARDGFYDGTAFHRVIPNFMAQGGDPQTEGEMGKDWTTAGDEGFESKTIRQAGSGGPGYQFADEFSTKRKHVTGALSMANAGPKTNGSQFFICYGPQPHLNGKHSVFGQLVEGMDALKKLKNGSKITKVTITESPKA